MRIRFIEIGNFRKLRSVHIDFTNTTTLFVGANNSGKTSAMVALRHFLRAGHGICVNDFTLSHWKAINEIGAKWQITSKTEGADLPTLADWEAVLPFMDVWLDVADDEIHHVSTLLPTLEWKGGVLGVRLRYEPKDIVALYKEFNSSIDDVVKTKNAAKAAYEVKPGDEASADAKAEEEGFNVTLWPNNMIEFLERKLDQQFTIGAYPLDPTKKVPPKNGIAFAQTLPAGIDALEGDPFAGLIRVDEINAQRGFGQATTKGSLEGGESESGIRRQSRKLSDQLRDYYAKHLDPFKKPEPADLLALHAIEKAQSAFDARLTDSFSAPFKEVERLGYPGVTDPRLKISTRIRPSDGLNHGAAVQYEVAETNEEGTKTTLRLPEDYNGLGYQNLISMVFKLMGFRDGWMRVGKAALATNGDTGVIPPIHLVLVEEPEAHLHAQVQQVFIRKAYDILRDHPDLGKTTTFNTQLIVSSHSSHVAHEMDFSCLRYFRRLPAGFKTPAGVVGPIPISTVINLSEVFGNESDTERFVLRYLRSTHCDLFFADAAIFVEGPAERILVPQFVRSDFKYLDQCYITWLEIGGSHAHRLRPLVEHLGLLTLIITDLDACDPAQNNTARQPVREQKQETNNNTLRTWIPKVMGVDDLLDMKEKDKAVKHDPLFSVRVAYQHPITVTMNGKPLEALANTFEDAVVFENLALFAGLAGTGLIAKFRDAIAVHKNPADLGQAMFESLKNGKKAEFALDLLDLQAPKKLLSPTYICEGLSWLEEQLKTKQAEVLEPVVNVAQAVVAIVAGATVPDSGQDQQGTSHGEETK